MCGICGILALDTPPRENDVAGMVRALKHRGPDDNGIWMAPQIILGHTRLSILDLSPRGHQPMTTPDGRFVVVFNGEIYNFADIRNELGGDAAFTSHSDTEVVLHAYRRYGAGCLEKFRGMFAFAIWDNAEQTLFLGRDRLGKKPLYFYADPRRFVFASEINALLALPWMPRRMDRAAVLSYLALQYVPGPLTIFENIRKLQPGSCMMVRIAAGKIQTDTRRYWTPPAPEHSDSPDLEERLDQLLYESVKLRLVSDVEVGVLLSGGLDSSLITSLAAGQSAEPMRSFSVRFADARFDEGRYAQAMAQRFGTRHHELAADEVTVALLHRILRHLDEPLADPAAIPTYLIAQCAAQHVKVILSGEGADELFGGYPHYLRERRWASFFHIPRRARAALAQGISGATESNRTTRRLAKVLTSPPDEGALRWVRVFSDEDLRRYLARDWQAFSYDPLETAKALYRNSRGRSSVEKSMDVDMQIWLPDDLLMKVDKMTMAHGLEARTPFLDHKLVELVSSLGADVKLRGYKTKSLLKKVAARHVPREIVHREKHGFEVPVASWLLHNFRSAAEEVFRQDALQHTGIFDPAAIRAEWDLLKAGSSRAYPRRLWLAFCLTQWQLLSGVGAPST